MRPDRLNLRVWLRDWLNKPTSAESRPPVSARHSIAIDPDTGLIAGTRLLADKFSVRSDPGECPEGPESPTPAT